MKIKNIRYTVEYYACTIWDDPYSDRKTFGTKEEALAFIHELSKDPLVSRAFYTTTEEISF